METRTDSLRRHLLSFAVNPPFIKTNLSTTLIPNYIKSHSQERLLGSSWIGFEFFFAGSSKDRFFIYYEASASAAGITPPIAKSFCRSEVCTKTERRTGREGQIEKACYARPRSTWHFPSLIKDSVDASDTHLSIPVSLGCLYFLDKRRPPPHAACNFKMAKMSHVLKF